MGLIQAFATSTQLETTQCITCGVTFAVPADMMNHARNKGKFQIMIHCPNGHSFGYRQSEADRLRAQLAAKDAELETAKRDAHFQRTQRQIREREIGIATKKLNRRLQAGVCLCCHRTFKQLAAHMKTKHPEHG